MNARTIMWSMLVVFMITSVFSIVMANIDRIFAFEEVSIEAETCKGELLDINEASFEIEKDKICSIGTYREENTSMCSQCSQNCSREMVSVYELDDKLENIDGINGEKTVFVCGSVIEVSELPTIAGPDSLGVENDKKIKAKKLKVEIFAEIDFPEISISKAELEKYKTNKEAIFILEFNNPFEQDLKIKINMKDDEIFQSAILKGNSVSKVRYVYTSDPNTESKRNDSFDVTVINDYVSEDNFKKDYYEGIGNEKENLVVFVEKFINLDDIEKK